MRILVGSIPKCLCLTVAGASSGLVFMVGFDQVPASLAPNAWTKNSRQVWRLPSFCLQSRFALGMSGGWKLRIRDGRAPSPVHRGIGALGYCRVRK